MKYYTFIGSHEAARSQLILLFFIRADFERKSVRKGGQSVETAVLPPLQMDCIEFIKSRMVLNVPGKETGVA